MINPQCGINDHAVITVIYDYPDVSQINRVYERKNIAHYLCGTAFVPIVFTRMDARPWMRAMKCSFSYKCTIFSRPTYVRGSTKHLNNDES